MNGYIVRSKHNPHLILCTDREFHAESQVGPGGWSARVYKTITQARRVWGNPRVSIERYDAR